MSEKESLDEKYLEYNVRTTHRVRRILGITGYYLVMAIITFYSVGPVLWAYIIAVKEDNWSGIGGAPVPDQIPDRWDTFLPENFFNMDTFYHVLVETNFVQAMINSFIVAVLTTLLSIGLSLMAAYAFSRFDFPFKGIAMDSVLVTQMFPGVLLMMPLFLVWARLGWLNTLHGLVLIYLGISVPYCTWMLKGFFDSIPKDLDESAMILGASRFRAFLTIVPLVLPGIFATALFTFITAWNEYMIALTFNTDPQYWTLPVGINQFFQPYRTPQYTYLAAYGLLAALPITIIFILLQNYLQKGLVSGAVK